MEEQLSPNRMNLLNLRTQIATAERGVGILEDKRSAIIKEFLRLYRDVITGRHTMRDKMQDAAADLFRAIGIEGREGVLSAAFAAQRGISVEVIERNVWGIKFPEVFHDSILRRLDARGYAFMTVSSTIDAAARRFEILLNLMLETASVEAHMRRIGVGVNKTTRRINAINEIVLPKARGQHQYIRRTLEEREREDILRLKKLKKVRQMSERGGLHDLSDKA